MNLFNHLQRSLVARVEKGLLNLSADDAVDWFVRMAEKKAQCGDAISGARFLMALDNRLELMHDRMAMRAAGGAGGVHPKHRLMNYHAFFAARINAAERVLDVGCSIGEVAADIVRMSGARVVGIDINKNSIAEARRRHSDERLTFVEGDATQAVPAGPFDVVVLSNVLEHIADRIAFLTALRKTTGAMRFLLRVPVFERDWRVPYKRELGLDWRMDDTHHTEYTLESFRDEMTVARLVIRHQEVRWGEIWAECVWRSDE